MPTFSYKKAKEVLKDKEMEKLVAMFIVSLAKFKPAFEDYEAGAAELGLTLGSFKNLYLGTIKKLKDSNAYIIEGEESEEAAEASETPVKKPGGRKRKADDGDGEGGKASKKRISKVKEEATDDVVEEDPSE